MGRRCTWVTNWLLVDIKLEKTIFASRKESKTANKSPAAKNIRNDQGPLKNLRKSLEKGNRVKWGKLASDSFGVLLFICLSLLG
jgi:hypothetical protein